MCWKENPGVAHNHREKPLRRPKTRRHHTLTRHAADAVILASELPAPICLSGLFTRLFAKSASRARSSTMSSLAPQKSKTFSDTGLWFSRRIVITILTLFGADPCISAASLTNQFIRRATYPTGGTPALIVAAD